jgi:hypothetical protein
LLGGHLLVHCASRSSTTAKRPAGQSGD